MEDSRGNNKWLIKCKRLSGWTKEKGLKLTKSMISLIHKQKWKTIPYNVNGF